MGEGMKRAFAAAKATLRKGTGCAHCDSGRKVIRLPNDPEQLPWHDNGSETLHPCVATIETEK